MRTVVITGGSKGIGFSTALRCLQEGCRVVILARNAERLKQARDELLEQSGRSDEFILTRSVDLADTSLFRRTISSLPWLGDGIDGLVNNAAVETLSRIEDFREEDMELTWRVNMLAPVVAIQECLPALEKRQGAVVNVSSVADIKYAELYSIYAGSKSFLNTFSRHVAKEIGFQGVRINVVSPGGVDTPLMEEIESKHFTPDHVRATLRRIPIEQRWGQPSEIANVIWFALFGPRYLHGADLRIDGGM